jgi:CO/xanthine dehydrogenase Mo-binding subunit
MPNASLTKQPNLDQWLSIGSDGRVLVRTGKVDIGQKISTALMLIAADELDIDPTRIDIATVETGAAPDEGITSGSNSMEESGDAVRRATATARKHLLALAAHHLDSEQDALEIIDGLIRARATNRSVSYWELAGGKPFGIPVDQAIQGKNPKSFLYVGKPATARGMADLVGGTATYVHDMTLPGMLHARVIRPPHYHAKLTSLDESKAGIGLVVARDGSFVAVVGADEYAVVKGAERLAAVARWDMGKGLSDGDLFAAITANERISLPVVKGIPVKEPVPPLAPPPKDAAFTHRARYERPYNMHATIGPSAAMALFENGLLTVWTHSQGIYVLREALSEALDTPIEAIKVIHAIGAGCYGHNGADDAALDAALVARAHPGTPILMKWTRADEHGWEPYTTAMVMELQASLDANGKVLAWSHESYGDTHNMRPRSTGNKSGAARLLAARYLADPVPPPVAAPSMGHHVGIHRNQEPLYNFANQRLVKNLVRGLPLRTSAMRTLGAYANVFALESFIDELAEQAGSDPVEFRIRNLADERAVAVVRATAEALYRTPKPDGRGRGIGFARYKNQKTYCAVGIELSVTDAAEVKLHRAVVAADAGEIVDPDGTAAQMEGGVLQAASWTLYEEVKYDRDGVTSRDWDSYPILRFDNVPEIETILMDRPGQPFLGAGEASSGPAAGAIANAIRDATGLRLRTLPFTPDNIRKAAMG